MAAELPLRMSIGRRQLFLDDEGIGAMEGLTRTMHRPAKKGAVIRPDPARGVDSIQIRSAPLWDSASRLFRLWDLSTPADLHAAGIACGGYHESPDGLHWRQPQVGQIEHRGSRANNLVSVLIDGRHRYVGSVAPGLDGGFVGLSYDQGQLRAVASDDGLRWAALDAPPFASDDEFNLSYDPRGRRYLATYKVQRPPLGRQVALLTSPDFRRWEDHGVIFHADEQDQRLGRQRIEARLADGSMLPLRCHNPADYFVDVYNMGLFAYEGLYLALPAMYHASGWIPNYPNTDGFQVVELMCSRDLKRWTRLGDREAFISPSPIGAGAYDLTQVLPPSAPVERGDELWFYYSGLKYRASFDYHGQYPHGTHVPHPGLDPDHGAICLAVLRRDGFVSLGAGDEPGVLTTRPLALEGPRLWVNFRAPAGEVRVEALGLSGEPLARGAPLAGDRPAAEVAWEEGKLLTRMGQAIRLRFVLRRAELFSYWWS